MRKIYDLLNVLLPGLLTYAVVTRYPSLPARIPVHFGVGGRPDRWGPKSEIFIFVAVAWGLTILFYVLTRNLPRLARNPRTLNIPRKEEFLKLSPEKQAVFWDLLREFMTGMAVSCNLIVYLAVQGVLRVIEKGAATLPFKDLAIGFAVLVLMLIMYLPRIISLPKKLVSGREV
jgi:uncharacterized membrane protein